MIKRLVATYKWTNNNGGGQYYHTGEESQLETAFINYLNDLKNEHSAWGNYIITSQNIYEIKYTDPSTDENINDNKSKPSVNDLKPDNTPNVSTSIENNSSNSTTVNLAEDIEQTIISYAAWDPRLQRFDEYFNIEGNSDLSKLNPIRIPFASNTTATAFADMSNTMEKAVAEALANSSNGFSEDTFAGRLFSTGSVKAAINQSENTNTGYSSNTQNNTYSKAAKSEKFITHNTNDLMNDTKGLFWGVQSIVNPYSLTKLCGGIEVTGGNKVTNYMYDIRDQRRFYAMQGNNVDPLAISNPSVTELINWSNHDLWGRTPYSFQDFVFCKYFGLIPNNRLITLRRYMVPTYDNLQFETMFGAQETTTQDSSGNKQTSQVNPEQPEPPKNKVFSPVASVVTWFGGDTGNTLKSLMSFTTGIEWDEERSQMWDVNGEEQESKQAVIDKLLDNGPHKNLYPSAELESLTTKLQGASQISAKVTSFGKFALALNGDIGQSQDAYDKLRGANVDPYTSTFKNRILGPVNRIEAVKKRKPGIKFSHSISITCEYRSKAIGGINPKAALLDVLGNCLEIVSPHALFWGGGHRFNIRPQMYPFHDGGWRDSFMARIYEGKFLGDDGAIATVLSGLKKVGDNGSGEFSMTVAKQYLGDSALGLFSGIVSGISNLFGGVDFLDSIASSAGENVSDPNRLTQGQNQAKNLFNNLKGMWNNRMIASTAMPSITSNGNLLVGEPVGEWHLTVGNPLNPIMVIGNLVCSDMKVDWEDELGPDDFPIGFKVTYTLDHAMARDSDAIQSMFNRGMGKFYTLPDYISTSSERITYVDKFTKDAGTGDVGDIPYKFAGDIQKDLVNSYGGGDRVMHVDPGSPNKSAGNYNTQLITPFTPINTAASRTVSSLRKRNAVGNMSIVKSLAATRKLINN